MRKISSLVTNKDAPSGGFSEGKFINNPGNDTGSEAVAEIVNDLYYGQEAIVKKYSGAVSDTEESESNSDVLDAHELMAGQIGPENHQESYDYATGNVVFKNNLYYRANRDIDTGTDGTTFAAQQSAGVWTRTDSVVSTIVATKDVTGGYPGLTLFKINLKNAAGTITSFLTSIATSARTWTFPDKDGTVAMTSDITAVSSKSSKRQTVLSGPITTGGVPAFLPSTSINLDLATTNISGSAPLVVSAAKGYNENGDVNEVGISEDNLSWTGLTASNTNYLYVTISSGVLTTGFTILKPVYQYYGTPSITSGQITFNVAAMKCYLGNGSSADLVNLVVIGEAVTDGSTVTSTTTYSFNASIVDGFKTIIDDTNVPDIVMGAAHCRAWVNFNGTGTVAIRQSFNVSSLVDNGTGDYTVNFAQAMIDANYATTAMSNGNRFIGINTSGTGSVRLDVRAGDETPQDASNNNIAVFR